MHIGLCLLLDVALANLRFLDHGSLFLDSRLAAEAVENRDGYLQSPGISVEQARCVLPYDSVVRDETESRESLGADRRQALLRCANAFLFGEDVGTPAQRLGDECRFVRN